MELSEAHWSLDYDGGDFSVDVQGNEIKGCKWTPSDSEPRYVYIFVHGLGVFSTFKRDFFDVILGHGGVVYATDHYGHGRSPGPRISGTIDMYIEETANVIAKAKGEYPLLPIIVHGHSMGGLTILALAAKHPRLVQSSVKAFVAEAPWLSTCEERELSKTKLGILNFVKPLIGNMSIKTGVDPYVPEEDPNWVEIMKAHPENRETISPNLYTSVVEAQTLLWKPGVFPSDLPMLFLQSRVDKLVNPARNIEWIETLMGDGQHPLVKKIIFDDGSHVLLKTRNRPVAARAILDFIEENIQQPTSE